MAIRFVDIDPKTGKELPPKPAEPDKGSWRDRVPPKGGKAGAGKDDGKGGGRR